jgi:hypothetical protein
MLIRIGLKQAPNFKIGFLLICECWEQGLESESLQGDDAPPSS